MIGYAVDVARAHLGTLVEQGRGTPADFSIPSRCCSTDAAGARAGRWRTSAESLGVSAPTFYQHLRAAESKLLAALLDDETE